MELINLGTALVNGKYFLHSKFKSVHNYSDNNTIISLVQSEIGKGPSNIVVKKLPKIAEENLFLGDGKLIIGEETMKISSYNPEKIENIYPNSLDQLQLNTEILFKNTQFKAKSLGFIFSPADESFFKSIFEKAFVQRVKDIMQDFSSKNLQLIAKNMRGIGFGLTPSGDDFNCGMLYGFHYVKNLFNKDFVTIIEEYYLNAIGTNLISNTFLKSAYQGLCYESFYNLLLALKKNNKQQVLFHLEEVLDSGHSSGSDMLTGFLYCIDKFNQNISKEV